MEVVNAIGTTGADQMSVVAIDYGNASESSSRAVSRFLSLGQMDDLETVFHAIQTLHGQEETSRAKASVWLTEFQKSVHAWQICDQIIHERRSVTSMYFASQTMRHKILFDFKELPVDSYGSLRDSLITHLMKVNCSDSKESVIMTQLALALVDLYLQVPNWPNFIAELLGKFSNNQNDRTLILLCLLKVCPEEARNQQVRVGQNRRNQVEAELASVATEVLKFLAHLCQAYQKNEDVIRRSILCLSSWLQNPQVPTNQLADNPILKSTLTVLQNPSAAEFEVIDAAAECISSALYRVEDVDQNQTFAKVLQEGVFGMVDAYKKAEAAEDYNKMQHYGRVFVEAGETFLESVVRCPGPCGLGDLRIFDLMLMLVESNDYNLLDMTFNVWYRLSEYLFQGIEDDDALASFKPYVRRYMKALLGHCRYESDITELPDPNDDFGELRTKISDSIKDVLFIIGVEECMHIVSDYYQTVEKTWCEVEAAVFFFSSIVHNILPNEETFVPSMLDTVIKTPDDAHPALLQTMIDLLENAEEWIRAHPACLEAVMEWLIRRLRDQRFAIQAAKTVSTICERNYSLLAKYFQPLFSIITEYESVIDKGVVLETAGEALLQACACLINDLPFEEFIPKFEVLIRRQTENLHRLCVTTDHKNPPTFRKRDSRTDQSWALLAANPITWLDRISCVYRYVKPWGEQEAVKAAGGHLADDVMHLVEQTWKVLLLTMNTFMRDVHVIEHSCRAVRFVIRSLALRSAPIVKELVHTMVQIYQTFQHSCFLYLGSILVDEYGGQEMFQQELLEMMQLLASYSFKVLQGEHGFRNNPDTVDDLFRMGIRFLQRAPVVFICAPICDLMFQCGIKGMQVDHQDANRSVTLFFDEVVNFITDSEKRRFQSEGLQAGRALYQRYGAEMTASALTGAIFYVSGGLKKDLCEVIDGVRRVNEQAFDVYLRQAVELLPHDTVCSATQEQLREFHAKVLKTRSRRELASQVRDLCAYYR
uniref:Importin N-terminal domain-containing protein n=1 Tax=Steinernema glaseri TaxID=37863 RepID=A0A1I8AW69_9BILA